VGRGLELERVVGEAGDGRGEQHDEREIAQVRIAANGPPRAAATAASARTATSVRGEASVATRSAPTPPRSPPIVAANATRARSGFAEWGSNRSLSSDQNAETAMPASTAPWACSTATAIRGRGASSNHSTTKRAALPARIRGTKRPGPVAAMSRPDAWAAGRARRAVAATK